MHYSVWTNCLNKLLPLLSKPFLLKQMIQSARWQADFITAGPRTQWQRLQVGTFKLKDPTAMGKVSVYVALVHLTLWCHLRATSVLDNMYGSCLAIMSFLNSKYAISAIQALTLEIFSRCDSILLIRMFPPQVHTEIFSQHKFFTLRTLNFCWWARWACRSHSGRSSSLVSPHSGRRSIP